MSGTAAWAASVSLSDGTSGETYALSAAYSVASMTAYDKRQVILSTTVRTLLQFDTVVGAGKLTENSGVMFINRDATQLITLGFIVSASKAFYVRISPGQFFVMWNRVIDTNVTGGAFAAFTNVTDITAASTAGTPYLEYIIMQA